MVALVTPAEVAAELRWKASQQTEYATVLASYIEGATPVIESLAGPIVIRTVEEIHDGGHPSVRLRHRPTAVESVSVASGTGYDWVDGFYVPTGGWLDITGWTADLTAAIVRGRFTAGHQNIKVTYTVGVATPPDGDDTVASGVPDNVKRATIALIVYNWRRVNPQQASSEEMFSVPQEYAIPASTQQWLRPQAQTKMPGFA